MKKGDYIQVFPNAKYAGQYMNWTEEKTGSKILPKGTKLLHTSDTKLLQFREKKHVSSQIIEELDIYT